MISAYSDHKKTEEDIANLWRLAKTAKNLIRAGYMFNMSLSIIQFFYNWFRQKLVIRILDRRHDSHVQDPRQIPFSTNIKIIILFFTYITSPSVENKN